MDQNLATTVKNNVHQSKLYRNMCPDITEKYFSRFISCFLFIFGKYILFNNMQKHIEAKHINHGPESCHYCEKQCASKQALQKHVSRYHREILF